jgi:hypothetical protein
MTFGFTEVTSTELEIATDKLTIRALPLHRPHRHSYCRLGEAAQGAGARMARSGSFSGEKWRIRTTYRQVWQFGPCAP